MRSGMRTSEALTATQECSRTSSWRPAVVGTDVVRQLCGDAVVTVVQTADFWNGDDTTGGRRCDRARARGGLVKREMGSRPHVVRAVLSEHAVQSRRIHHDHVIEALASDRTNDRSTYAFCQGDRGAVRTACVFIPAMVVATPAKTESRSCRRYLGASFSERRCEVVVPSRPLSDAR